MSTEKWIVLVLASQVLLACTGTMSARIERAVDANKSAQSLSDWASSPDHPDALFADLRAESGGLDGAHILKKSEEICSELSGLSGQELSLFEEQIRAEENSTLLSVCAEQLLAKIEKHFVQERETLVYRTNPFSLQNSGSNFRFSENIQKRDMSRGYKAITGDVAKKEVVLTFDDGPSNVYTRSILSSLAEVNAKAMFFMLGKNVRVNPEIVKLAADEGHAVGSHSVTHPCLPMTLSCRRNNGRMLSQSEAEAEIRSGHQAIFDVLGFVDPIFRFPYGATSPELSQFLRNNGTAEFFWAVDSEDWRAQSNQNLIQTTLKRIEERGRGVVLFHDIQRRTAEIMPQFLAELYFRGYTVVLLQPLDPNQKFNSPLVKKKIP